MSELNDQRPSIRLRRLPSSASLAQVAEEDNGTLQVPAGNRRRSQTGPSRLGRMRSSFLPQLEETPQSPTTQTAQLAPAVGEPPVNKPLPDLPPNAAIADGSQEYESSLVDLLDLIDPEVQTLSTLTNVQNSLFVPDLGRFVNRRPSYTLSRPTYDSDTDSTETTAPEQSAGLERTETTHTLAPITSRQTAQHYAVLPHGVRLEGWNAEDRRQLDEHVRHMLHSRRSRFKRSMKGFGQYIRKPLGFFITLYAVLITLFGLAWVLFLIGWVNIGGRKDYIINIIDNVLVALFAIMGDGLAPFRIVDTYHMIFIAHYHHLTWRLRREKSLPKLQDRNDLPPLPPVRETEDVEAQAREVEAKKTGADEFCPNKYQFSVLTVKQQRNLVHHQKKFSRSHTFYKSHETSTHYAFPLRLLVAIVVLLDCHSLLQISLGACTWGISYHVRPFTLTTVILCCSITVNITAGVLISVGDRKTRKKDVLEKMHRQELTAEAMKKLEKAKKKEIRNLARGGDSSEMGYRTVNDEAQYATNLEIGPAATPPTVEVSHH